MMIGEKMLFLPAGSCVDSWNGICKRRNRCGDGEEMTTRARRDQLRVESAVGLVVVSFEC